MGYAALGTVESDSVGERIRRAVPHARVVKMPNAIGRRVRVGAGRAACVRVRGRHRGRGAGDGAVRGVRPTDRVLDLCGIRSARVLEMCLPLRLAPASASRCAGRVAEREPRGLPAGSNC
ncbi:hypothetical protein GCM10009787_44970 [Streptomyces bangladeshensis]|uniref:Uncharacterized protein n=1 Tax=Streptomyces bangladeshensis TaxID=295352 RepID=A0ABN3BQF6_9ACTN